LASISSNLFRTSLDGGGVVKNGTLEQIKIISDSAAELLRTEIEILQPTSVIFFTGPDYDHILEHYYSDIKYEAILLPTRSFAKLHHPQLPVKSYRTYHPRALSQQKLWENVFSILGQELGWLQS
jgi:hypothetical protein